jgi:hypothetical protein
MSSIRHGTSILKKVVEVITCILFGFGLLAVASTVALVSPAPAQANNGEDDDINCKANPSSCGPVPASCPATKCPWDGGCVCP